MSKFPSITGNQIIKSLQRHDFIVLRIKGSHHFLQHLDGRRTVVPVHRSEAIGKGLLAQILRDCEITFEELCKR